MKKKTRKITEYMCEVCFVHYASAKMAQKCENQKPIKVTLIGEGKYFKDWKIGDLVALRIHDDIMKWRLAQIIGQKQDEHKLLPIFDYLGFPCKTETYSFGFRHEEAILLKEEERKQIKNWIKLIRETETDE